MYMTLTVSKIIPTSTEKRQVQGAKVACWILIAGNLKDELKLQFPASFPTPRTSFMAPIQTQR